MIQSFHVSILLIVRSNMHLLFLRKYYFLVTRKEQKSKSDKLYIHVIYSAHIYEIHKNDTT